MKKILITLFLILSAITSAQNFFPTKPGDAYQFQVDEQHEWPIYHTFTWYKKSFAEEYIFQNQTYVKLWDRYFRMDSNSNKLYTLINGEEKLACDFNKPTGSTDNLYFGIGGFFTYYNGSTTWFGQSRLTKEIRQHYTPFTRSYAFADGIGFYYEQDVYASSYDGYYKYHFAIAGIISAVVYNPISLGIYPDFPAEISSSNTQFSIPVDIIAPYPGLVNYLAADIVVFAGGSQVYQQTFNGNIELEKIDIILANSILAQADSVGIRVTCEDESIFSNIVSYPLSGYHFVPVVNEISWNLLIPSVWGDYNRAIKFFTKDVGFIFIANHYYYPDPPYIISFKSTDGGNSFGSTDVLDFPELSDIISVSDSIGYFVNGSVKKTTNQGETWFYVDNHPDNPSAIKLSSINADTVWFSGRKFMTNYAIAKVYRTYDGGQNWEAFNTSLQEAFLLIDFAAVNDGYAVTQSGKIYRSADGGETWQFTNVTIANQKELNMFREGKGWLTGNGIWRTEDGGINWTRQFSGNFVDAHFFNADKGWVIGTANGNNVLLFTNNGGADWNEIEVPEMGGAYLYLDFVDKSHGWIYSANKRLLKTTNGGVTFVDDERFDNFQPTEFMLSQNYPNPFNPSTTISWQSPVAGWQTIKVYDVLGNEVATLVDEYRNAGSYNEQFTINNLQLSSGIYFYQLKAANHVETKKMLLIK